MGVWEGVGAMTGNEGLLTQCVCARREGKVDGA